MAGATPWRVPLAAMNEDDLNAMEPIPLYRRAAPWLLFIGFPILAVLLILRLI
jgi:hypothetical protein